MKFHDRERAVSWAREHWHVAGFICAALLVVDVWLVYLKLLSARADVAAGLAGVIYVVLETWRFTALRALAAGRTTWPMAAFERI